MIKRWQAISIEDEYFRIIIDEIIKMFGVIRYNLYENSGILKIKSHKVKMFELSRSYYNTIITDEISIYVTVKEYKYVKQYVFFIDLHDPFMLEQVLLEIKNIINGKKSPRRNRGRSLVS